MPSTQPPHRRGARGALVLTIALVISMITPAALAHHGPPYISGPDHQFGEIVDDYPLVFPVVGEYEALWDTFWAWRCCDEGEVHHAQDLMADKGTPVVAAAAGTVKWTGSNCCSVFIEHDDGWETWYIHLNNDTPGTDDGQGWGIAPGIERGTRVEAGQLIGWVGDSGNAEDTPPHLHFELLDPHDVIVNPMQVLLDAEAASAEIVVPDSGDPGDGNEPPPSTNLTCNGLPVTHTDTDGDGIIVGSEGDDVIAGTNADDIIVGKGGDDTICGAGGDDIIAGDGGFDTIYAGGGNDLVNGGDGSDVIDGEGGNDRIDGDAGDDIVRGGTGNDSLEGGPGLDFVSGGSGSDTLFGGNDTTQATADTDVVDPANDDDTLWGNGGNDRLHGGPGRDLLKAGGGNDSLWGDDGNDVLMPGGGTDSVFGGAGDDMIKTGDVKDSIDGGDGIDTANYKKSRTGINVDLGAGRSGNGTITDVENVVGTKLNDFITGNDAPNRLQGKGGDDTIHGAGGPDRVIGGAGADSLSGGLDSDVIAGGSGRDTADGGPGNDTCKVETATQCEA